MSDLTEFLLARIADQEKSARGAEQGGLWHRVPHTDECDWWGDMPGWCSCNSVARVLAECEAKRRIVTLMGYVRESWENHHAGEGRVMWHDVTRREKSHAYTVLETLAAVYSDHPDYREAWRP